MSGTRCKKKPQVGMNKTEAIRFNELDLLLKAGEIAEFRFEGMKLRLADGAYYKPDFYYIDNDGQIHFDEIKGFWREAARVRIKVAADRFPHFRFAAFTRRTWKEERVRGPGWKIERFY